MTGSSTDIEQSGRDAAYHDENCECCYCCW